MRPRSTQKKQGQTAAAKVKETIFQTTFPDPAKRQAAYQRFEVAPKASVVLPDLCRDHSYGVLILIPPNTDALDLQATAAEVKGFREALRLLLSSPLA